MISNVRETVKRSIAKAVSYRLWGEAVTFGVAYAFTGSVRTAASISAVEVLIKLGMYATHERVWNRVPWGIIQAVSNNRPEKEGGLEQSSRPALVSYEPTT